MPTQVYPSGSKMTMANIVRCLGVTSTIFFFSLFLGFYCYIVAKIYESSLLVPVILAFSSIFVAIWSFIKLQITDMKSTYEETNENIKFELCNKCDSHKRPDIRHCSECQ